MEIRCKRCGGRLYREVLSTSGEWLMRCHSSLTEMKPYSGDPVGRLIPCETYHDEAGQVYTGMVAYRSGGEVKVVDGVPKLVHADLGIIKVQDGRRIA